MKKISLFPLLIALALLQFGASLGFSQTFTNGDWTYTLNASNEATITAHIGAGGTVTVPSEIGGHPVRVLGAEQMRVFQQPGVPITSVIIGDGIKRIAAWAFRERTDLQQVYIPNTVEDLGWDAFAYCHALREVNIPGSVTNISGGAFFGCSALTNIGLVTGLKSIGGFAFWQCGIRTLEIPNTVTHIGSAAIGNCRELTNIHVPASVASLEGGFARGVPISEISVDANNTNYKSVDGVVFQIEPSVLVQYPAGKTGAYTIPDNVSRIARSAFVGSAIQSLSIPTNIVDIEEFAFDGVVTLTNVSFAEGVTNMGYCSFRWSGITSALLPDSLLRIGEHAFFGCGNLTNANLGSSLAYIEGYPGWWNEAPNSQFIFGGCQQLTNISVSPANATYSSLEGVLFDKARTTIFRFPEGRSGTYVIPTGVTNVWCRAFAGASALTCISLPSSVSTISEQAFGTTPMVPNAPTNLISVTIQGSPSFIGKNIFDSCNSLTAVIFLDDAPASVSMPVFSTNSSTTVYRLSHKSGWSNSFAGRPTALIDCLFTKQQLKDATSSGFSSGRSQGQIDVTTDPPAFNLFTKAQFDANRTNGQTDVTSNPNSFGLYTANQYNANRTHGIQSVLDTMPSVDLIAPSTAFVRAGLGTTNITAVTVSNLPSGWQYDAATRQIYGRLERTSSVATTLFGARPTGETIPITFTFAPVAPDITSISIPLSSTIQAGKKVKLPLTVWNNSTLSKSVNVEFSSSDEGKLAAPATFTITVPGKNISSGKPGRATKVINVTAGNIAGEVELVASVGNVSSAPCAVTIKAARVRL